jgi:type I restriction enzyme S subunit
MKEGWEIKTLGEVCKTSSGGTPLKTNKSFYSNPTVPWLLSGEVKDKELHHSLNYISEEGLKGSSAKIFPPNTVLVAMYGATAGQSSILRFESSTNQAICGILPSSHLLAEFIYYYFNFFKENLIAQATGNAQPNISQEKIKNIRIPIPPLPEQQRIVSIIDKSFEAIDKAIENTKKNLQNAKELFESYLNSVFENGGEGWEIKTLGEVCIVERGSSPRPIEKYQTSSPDGVNWIKIGDTKGIDKYIYTTKEKITKEGAEKSRHVKEGDFILSNSMSFGKPYIMKTDGYIHDGWFVFRIPNFIDKDYFYQLISSPTVQDQIQSLGAGSIVKNISGDLVKKVTLTYPSKLPEQELLALKIETLNTEIKLTIAKYQQKLRDLEELKKSILNRAFAGEL